MKLGIMQPYFFPYLGYFDVINYADKWIVFDTVQYIRHGWINRNRILHPKEGWQYILIPLKKHSRSTAIKDIEVADHKQWGDKLIGQLQHYKKKAPYFQETIVLVKDSIMTGEHSLSRMNVFALEKVCARLGIEFDFDFYSEMNLDISDIEEPGDWAMRISEALGAKEYVNSPGGAGLFNDQKFAGSNIKLVIRDLPPFEYTCRGYTFIPNLSIIDLLMWNEPHIVKRYLDEHKQA